MVDGDFDLIKLEEKQISDQNTEIEVSENESVQGSAGFFEDGSLDLPGLDLPEDVDEDMIPVTGYNILISYNFKCNKKYTRQINPAKS